MPRMSKIQISEMKNEYNNSIKQKDIISCYMELGKLLLLGEEE